MVKYLISMGKVVPQDLLKQIAQDKNNEIQRDSYNNFNNFNNKQQTHSEPILPPYPQQNISQQQLRKQHPPHKYSPQYANYIGAKPRAQASTRLGMGRY